MARASRRPAFRFALQLFSSRRRQPVEPRPAVVLARCPVRGKPATVFQTLERRIGRALFYLQHVLRRALVNLRDRMAVRISGKQWAQDHPVERPLQHFLFRSGVLGTRATPLDF